MNTFISINSIALRKLLKRYILTSKGTEEIIKEAKKGFSISIVCNSPARKIEFKESYIN